MVLIGVATYGADHFYTDQQGVGYDVFEQDNHLLSIAFIPSNSSVSIPEKINIEGTEWTVAVIQTGASNSEIVLPSLKRVKSSIYFSECTVTLTDVESWVKMTGFDTYNWVDWIRSTIIVNGKPFTVYDARVYGPVVNPAFKGYTFDKVIIPSFPLVDHEWGPEFYEMQLMARKWDIPSMEHLVRLIPYSDTWLSDEPYEIMVNGSLLDGMVKVPEGTTVLHDFLQRYPHITGVTLPSSLRSLQNKCFVGCKNLSQIVCQSSEIEVDGSCFNSCPITGPTVYVGDMLVHVSSEENGVFNVRSGTKYIREASFYFNESSDAAFSNTPMITSIVLPAEYSWRAQTGSNSAFTPEDCGASSVFSLDSVNYQNFGNAVWALSNKCYYAPYNVRDLKIADSRWMWDRLNFLVHLPCLESLSLSWEQFKEGFKAGDKTPATTIKSLEISNYDGQGAYGLEKQSPESLILSGNTTSFNTLSSIVNIDKVKSLTVYGISGNMGDKLPFANLECIKVPVCGLTDGHFGSFFNAGNTSVSQQTQGGVTKTYTVPSSLHEVELAEGCTTAEFGAFYNFSMLTSVTLPSTMTLVGEKSFHGCAGITTLHIKAAIPPAAYDNSFEGMRTSFCRLIVPAGSADLYRNATGWRQFSVIEEEEGVVITLKPNIRKAGEVIGALQYAKGTPMSLRAAANSGYAFHCWMTDGKILSTSPMLNMDAECSMVLEPIYNAVVGENDVTVSGASDGMVVINIPPVDGATGYVVKILDPSGNVAAAQTLGEVSGSRTRLSMEASFDNLDTSVTYQYVIMAFDLDGCLEEFRGFFCPGSANVKNIDVEPKAAAPFMVEHEGLVMLDNAATLTVYTIAGATVTLHTNVNAGERIHLASGLYVVVIDTHAYKVAI